MRSRGRVLIVDDERSVRYSIGGVLEDEGFEIEYAASGEECLAVVSKHSYDAILLDVKLPNIDGIETLHELGEREFAGAVIMISGHATIETAVKATKAGAFDFLEKPPSTEKTVLVLKNAIRQRSLEAEVLSLKARMSKSHTMIGESEPIRKLQQEIQMATGAPGSGFKDLRHAEARFSHQSSVISHQLSVINHDRFDNDH